MDRRLFGDAGFFGCAAASKSRCCDQSTETFDKIKRGFGNMLDGIDGKELLIRVESQTHTVILPNPSSHDLLKKHTLFGIKGTGARQS